jgi:hypothetical protein
MKAKKPTDPELRKIFCEIVDGSTPSAFEGQDFFVKHLRQKDQYHIETHKEEVYQKAKEKGLPTYDEAIATLIENDIWSKEEEAEIETTQEYVENLRQTKKNLLIPSQIESINKDIEEAETKLNALKQKKDSMLTQTCEGYSESKNNDYIVYFSLFKDYECSERLFSWEEFGELPKTRIGEIVHSYSDSCKHLNLDNIKYLSISAVFSLYYNLTGGDSIYDFFRKPLHALTFYQLNLLNYARVLHSILENVEGIPEAIKEEPDDLLDYAESKKRNKNVVDKSKDKQGFSVVGATRKDMDEMGVSDEVSVSPFDLAKKKGALTLEDFQDFS